jgi:hypothetical protein
MDGRSCQPWAFKAQVQHSEDGGFLAASLEDAGSGDVDILSISTFCRNPDRKPQGLWCHTKEPVWEHCNISTCYGMWITSFTILKYMFN